MTQNRSLRGLAVPTDRRPPESELDLPAMRDFANEMRAGTGDDLGPMFFRDVVRLVARLEAAEVEASAQMGAKIEAQMTLKLVTEALDLSFAELGNGWREATPKILARIETIVDEADRAFRERDAALAAAAPGETTLAEPGSSATGSLRDGLAPKGAVAGRGSAGERQGRQPGSASAAYVNDYEESYAEPDARAAPGETERTP